MVTEPAFLIKLVLSFVIGSLWILLATIAAERFGSKMGGLIGGIPSTVVVSLFFLGWTQSPEFVVEVTEVFPAAFAINGLFTVIYAMLARKGLIYATGGAVIVWFVLELLLILSGLHSFILSLILWITLLGISFYLLEYRLQVRSQVGIIFRYRALEILGRALFSGSMITFAILMGNLGGPVMGSAFSSFPAVFLSNLVIVHRSLGYNFALGLTKSLMFSGLINCVVYATAVRFLYPSIGLFLGTVLACAITLISVYLTYRFIKKEMT